MIKNLDESLLSGLHWQGIDPESDKTDHFVIIFFNLVECASSHNDTNYKVVQFIEKFPKVKNQVQPQNLWTAPMYAARYNNIQLLKHFVTLDFKLQNPGCYTSIIHAACYGNACDTLKYLLQQLSLSPNPNLSDIPSPLRHCVANGFIQLSSILIRKGAYFYIDKKLSQGVQLKDEKFLLADSQVVMSQHVLKAGDPLHRSLKNLRQTIRLARGYNLLALRQTCRVQQQTEWLQQEDGWFKNLLEILVNQG